MKEWRKPKNKKELSPGSRVRFIHISKGLLDKREMETIRRLYADKSNHAADFIGKLECLVWMYGKVGKSQKVVTGDTGGSFAMPSIKMVEVYVDSGSWKDDLGLSGPIQSFRRFVKGDRQ